MPSFLIRVLGYQGDYAVEVKGDRVEIPDRPDVKMFVHRSYDGEHNRTWTVSEVTTGAKLQICPDPDTLKGAILAAKEMVANIPPEQWAERVAKLEPVEALPLKDEIPLEKKDPESNTCEMCDGKGIYFIREILDPIPCPECVAKELEALRDLLAECHDAILSPASVKDYDVFIGRIREALGEDWKVKS